MPKLVIFDCDGVLVDSEPVSNRVLQESLARHGLELSHQECLRIFTGLVTEAVREKAVELGAVLPATWESQVNQEDFNELRKGVEAIPGIKAVLDHLRSKGTQFCVASNGEFEKMQITLGQSGLISYFDGAMFSAPALGTAKPDPALFLYAAAQFGMSACDCVVIEDSTSGARAARRAGMRCFGYSTIDDASLLAEGAILFKNMNELPSLLGLE